MMIASQRERRDTEETLQALPPEIEAHLTEWGERLASIDALGRVDPFEVNRSRWEMGRAMASVLDHLGSEQGITRVLDAVAARLRRSRMVLYHYLWVARAWPDELPRRPWTALRMLARWPKPERDRLNADLPLDAPASAIPTPERRQQLTPEGRDAQRESDAAERLLAIARRAYAALPDTVRAFFVIEALRQIDLSRVESDDCRRRIAGLMAAADADNALPESEDEPGQAPPSDEDGFDE